MNIKEKDVLETIRESAIPAIVATDIKGRITFYSRGAEQLLGYKSGEIIGKKAEMFYLKGYPEACFIMKAIRENDKLQNYKTKIISKNKTIIPVLLEVSAVKSEQGELIGTIGVFTSMLEEQKLEEQIRKQERFLAFILLNSAEAIMVLDMEDRILVWNKGAERIFGYTEEEVKGQKYYFLVPPDLEAKGEIQFLSNQLIEKGYINDYITERICKDGRRIIISLTRSLITDENNKPIGSSTIVRDITYQKKLEKQMVFTEKMATIGKLASSLAHEIGTPISILMGRAEYLKKIASDDEEICRCLDIIMAQAEKITKKVSNLLNVARQSQPEITRVSLKSIISSVLDLLRSKFDKMGIEVVCQFRKEGVILNADADMMQQVFINLLVNAIDALKKKQKKRIDIIIDVGDYTDKRMAIIEIIDTGCGITPENINRIFDPFFTTKERGEGTGLGLSIVARIVQEHKGYIEVQSIVKKGTRFVIKLPIDS